jgi:hypothetical protein
VVALQWTLSGTHTGPFLMPGGEVLEPTGQRVAVRGCSVRTMENGLILTDSVYYDQLELLARIAPVALADPLAPPALLAPLASVPAVGEASVAPHTGGRRAGRWWWGLRPGTRRPG